MKISKSVANAIVVALTSSCLLSSTDAVTCRITFNGEWVENQVDPGTYPGSAHFTPMVGSTHKPGQAFWEPGGIASTGMEDLAELGITADLESEVSLQILNNDANNYFQVAADLFNLPNSDSTTVTTDGNFNEVTLASMVAPSPDWFVGVYNETLSIDGVWRPDFTVDLVVWDADTEAGITFNLNNPASNPQESISLLSENVSPFIRQPVVGTIQFELVSDPSLPDLGERGVQISRIDFATQVVTLRNFGGVEQPLDGWRFCTHDENVVRRYSGSTGLNGITLAPGEKLNIHFLNDASAPGEINISSIVGNFAIPLDSGSYGIQLYFDPVSFGNGNTIADHLQ